MGKWLRKLTAVVLAVSLAAGMHCTVFAGGDNSSTGGTISSGGNTIPTGVKGTWVPLNAEGTLAGYVMSNGAYLQDGFTADGFYVNRYGVWAPSVRILDAWVPTRNSWLPASMVGEFEGFVPFMSAAQKKLNQDTQGYRVISVYSNRIIVSSVATKDKKRDKTTRLAMYKNPDFNGYTIQVSTELSGDEKEMPNDGGGEWSSMSYYDYQVLRLLCWCVSRAGDKVATAIYSSWEDRNAYDLKMNVWVQVGDTLIRYLPSEGAGLYEIRAAF